MHPLDISILSPSLFPSHAWFISSAPSFPLSFASFFLFAYISSSFSDDFSSLPFFVFESKYSLFHDYAKQKWAWWKLRTSALLSKQSNTTTILPGFNCKARSLITFMIQVITQSRKSGDSVQVSRDLGFRLGYIWTYVSLHHL